MNKPAPAAVRPLSLENDRNIGFHADGLYEFARKQRLVGLSSDEIRPAATVMPLVLRRRGQQWWLLGVMCFLGGDNILLGPAGGWQAPYTPRMLQLYPLALDVTDRDNPALGSCADSPRLSTVHANKLIDASGQATDFYRGAVASLLQQNQDRLACSVLIEALFQAGLLKEMDENNLLVPANGQFYTIDKQALDSVDADTLKSLQQSRALDIFYAVFYAAATINRYRWLATKKAKLDQVSAAGMEGMLAPAQEASFNFDN